MNIWWAAFASSALAAWNVSTFNIFIFVALTQSKKTRLNKSHILLHNTMSAFCSTYNTRIFQIFTAWSKIYFIKTFFVEFRWFSASICTYSLILVVCTVGAETCSSAICIAITSLVFVVVPFFVSSKEDKILNRVYKKTVWCFNKKTTGPVHPHKKYCM